MAKAVSHINKLSPSQFWEFGKRIAQAVDSSPDFQDSDEYLDNLNQVLNELETLKGEIDNLEKNLASKRSKLAAARSSFKTTMNDIVSYVNRVAKGEAAIIYKSGLSVKRSANNKVELKSPTTLQVTRGDMYGEIVLNWELESKHTYRAEYTATPEDADSWKFFDSGTAGSFRAKLDLAEIGIGEEGVNRSNSAPRVFFRLSAKTNRGSWGDWCDPVGYFLV